MDLSRPRKEVISLTILGLIALVFIPLMTRGYILRFFTKMLLWIALAQSWNTITGYTGRVDFGHVMFFGVGAYACNIFSLIMGFPWVSGIFVGIIVAALAALFVGIPTLRLTGAYFAIATWCVAEAVKWAIYILPRELTGSAIGLFPTLISSNVLYYLTFICVVVAVLINFLLERSDLGYSLRAIRESEIAAEALGINAFRPKLMAYIISAIPAALAGVIYASWVGYLHPFDAFDMVKTDNMIVMTLIGGMGSFLGPIIGSIFFTVVFEILWTYVSGIIYLVFLAVVIILVVLFIPKGILGIERVASFLKKMGRR